MRISDWSSDVCSSDLLQGGAVLGAVAILQVDEAETGHGQEGRQRGKARALRRADLAIAAVPGDADQRQILRSEEQTSELQSLMHNSYAVFCLIKKQKHPRKT